MTARIWKGQQVPADFAAELRELRATRDRRYAVTLVVAKMNGWTYQALADAVGVSRQAVEQAAAKAGTEFSGRLPVIPLPPRKPEPEPKAPARRRLLINDELAERLREMQRIAATVNGGMPADAPERRTGEEFTALLHSLTEQGVSVYHIAQTLGVHYNAVVSRLARHGYRKPTPSQASARYLGRPGDRASGAQTHCKRGHELAGDNLYVLPKSGRRVCRACQQIRATAYYQRKQAALRGGEES
ncbi:hypothetical protein [Streptomyces sp. NPDC057336]|uniref:hypothetical protein n=1 Tax=Streptomyces sp. NPDC057336 TaxID=3346102 RepID=UPI00364343C9